jgi:hypothetical protein
MTTRHDGIFESERSVGPQSPAGGQVPVHHYTGRGPAPRSGNGTTTLENAHGQ